MKDVKLFKIIGAVISVGAFGALILLERHRPLRRNVESKLVRDSRNLAVGGLSATVLQLFENPIVQPLTKLVERKNLGLLRILKLPRVLETFLAVILMDYTLYIWHVLTHKSPFLWRFHLVHHIDLDLDASTALRFHFAEMMISIAWRSAQVLIIGVSPRSFAAWQMFLFPSILFHHSNWRLPLELERKINFFLVTPRMHGIHHSIVREETDSNLSSGLTVWDRLHGTLKTDATQKEITIGVPAYQNREEIVLPKLLKLPFEKQKNDWQVNEAKETANQLK